MKIIMNSLISLTVIIAFECCAGIQTDRPYQDIGRAEHFILNHSGYIIGLEKQKIEDNDENRNLYQDKFKFPGDISCRKDQKNSLAINNRYRVFCRTTSNQNKAMIATQLVKTIYVAKTEANEAHFYNKYFYNSYHDTIEGEYDLKKSFAQLDMLFDDLANQLEKSKPRYTHILIMSMGWNNDQAESLFRYNTILKNISVASKEPFNPLVITLTWPSVWGSISDFSSTRIASHLSSYMNKADDADEIGYTWMNWIVNHKLPEALRKANLRGENPKVVMIGHSFGARILSRALYSSEYIDPKFSRENIVDQFIGLQGAFSLKRFRIDKNGREGNPYSEFRNIKTAVVLTSSTHDSSNFAAVWSKNAGGEEGLNYARDHVQTFDVFDWKEKDQNILPKTTNVLVINASSIVNDQHNDKGSIGPHVNAHNDILDAEMGTLIWTLIK